MKNYEYEILKDSVNIVLEGLDGQAEHYRRMSAELTDQEVKMKYEWLANGIDEAVRIITKVLPMKREHVEIQRDVPSEAPATSVA